MKAISRLGTIAVLLLTTLLMSGTAQAKTITVDGDGTDWATAPAQAILVNDPDEVAPNNITQDLDIGDVYFTNDTTNIYWRFDTLAATDWSFTILTFCFDTDANAATGRSVSLCNNLAGIDYIIQFDSPDGGTTIGVSTSRYCSNVACLTAFSTTGVVGAFLGNITEIAIPIVHLRETNTGAAAANGIPTSCTTALPCLIPTLISFGIPAGDPDDSVSLRTAPEPIPQIPAVPTPVTLTSFTATTGGAGVDLAWATASELNVLGYNIYRGSSDDRTAATKISPSLIAATGDGVSGASYSWADSSAAAGTIYRYWLEVVDTDGTTEEYGPVALAPEVAALSPRLYLPLIQR